METFFRRGEAEEMCCSRPFVSRPRCDIYYNNKYTSDHVFCNFTESVRRGKLYRNMEKVWPKVAENLSSACSHPIIIVTLGRSRLKRRAMKFKYSTITRNYFTWHVCCWSNWNLGVRIHLTWRMNYFFTCLRVRIAHNWPHIVILIGVPAGKRETWKLTMKFRARNQNPLMNQGKSLRMTRG